MKYALTTPCADCPFLRKNRTGYTLARLNDLSDNGSFHCHKTGTQNDDGDFVPTESSVHCAGALIFLEKRKRPNQMMRISERLGLYDYRKLDMKAPVR